MKNLNIKTITAMSLGPILGSFLFLGCGGDSNDLSTINTSNLFPADAYSFVYPKNGDTNVCTGFTGRISSNNQIGCAKTSADLQNAIQVTDASDLNAKISVGVAGPFRNSDGSCEYQFNVVGTELSGLHNYRVGLGSTASSTLQNNTASFTTSNTRVVTCAGSPQRFIVNGFPDVPLKPNAINKLGTYDSVNNKYDFQVNQLWSLLTTIVNPADFIVPPTLDPNRAIHVAFNERPNLITLGASFGVFERDRTAIPPIGARIAGTVVPTVGGSANMYEFRRSSGVWTDDTSYIVIIADSTTDLMGRVLSAEGASTAQAWAGVFQGPVKNGAGRIKLSDLIR